MRESEELTAQRVVDGIELQPGDTLSFGENGNVSHAHFATPREFRGHAEVRVLVFDHHGVLDYYGVGDSTFRAKTGILRDRRLGDQPALIDGVVCILYALFDTEGRLAATTIAVDLETPHGTLPAGSKVRFHPDGSVKSAQVGGPCTLAGQSFETNDPARFEDGTVTKTGWTFFTPS